jgi:hypothetical protein
MLAGLDFMAIRTIARRLLLLSPFGVAAVLTIIVTLTDRLHMRSERIAGYCFLFATPWAWLLDQGSFPKIHSRWLEAVVGYVLLLWIPALLYSASLWLLLRAISFATRRAQTA